MTTTQLTIGRVDAIDVFRGLTMFFMLWVNSFWTISGEPHWLQHAVRGEDMLGFSDTIFPAFLFIMGASVPLAIQKRRSKGDPTWKLLLHIVIRSVALLIMGLYTVNQEAYGGGDGMLSRTMFSILMVIGFFLVWNAYPKSDGWKKYLFTGMQIVGAALLVWLALSFVDRDGGGFGIRWWGILGRIGWTYLFCCIAYVVIGKRMWWHLGLTAVLVVLSILQSEQLIPGWLANHYTIYAFGMSGVSLSMLLQRYADRSNPKRFYLIMLLIGVGMLIAGFVAHPHWIISKLSATPTWYFFCCAIFFPLFGLIYMITDVKGKTLWFNLVKPAGTAALSCYVLAYAFPIKSISLSNLLMRPEFSDGILGLFNLLCYALLLIWTVWLLGKVYIRLKV